MEDVDSVPFCKNIKDKIEPVWHGMADPVGRGDDEDIHLTGE